MNFASRSISVNNSKEFFTMPQNLTASSWRLYLPYEGKRAADSYRPWKSFTLGRGLTREPCVQ
jgi:hypothetical protein